MTKSKKKYRRKQQKQFPVVPIAVGLLLMGFAIILATASPKTEGDAATSNSVVPMEVSYAAPELSLQNINGETEALADYHDQVVLVNNWATWCPPCRAEMKSIEKVYNEYKDHGLVVLAVDMTYQDDPTKIAPFVAEQGLTFPILLDESGAVGKSYQLRSLPSSYFINRDGIINEVVIGGPMAEALLRTRVEEILK